MENKLEQLLNRLIEKGFRPFGKKADHCLGCRYNNDWSEMYKYVGFWGGDDVVADRKVPLRSLVSKSSGLWQFVCDREHRFIDKKNYEGARSDKRLKNPYVDYDGVNTEYEWITSLDYQFWLIESSLKDESELEDFLLNSIKID